MKQLNLWFVCFSLVAVSCKLPEALGGPCANDLDLGAEDCQCVTPDTRYSEGSLGYVDPKEKNLWHCSNEFGSVRVDLGPSDVYACHNYRCVKYTCNEDEIPNKDKLECIKKPDCGEHEVYLAERNTCVCQEPAYVKIGDQCVESVESSCDKTKEVYDKSSNTCSCHAEAHWIGDVGSCTCATGYVEIMKRCVESREETCDKPKEAFDPSHNLCICNADGNWTGTAGACVCKDGFVPVGKVCMEKVSCTGANETYDATANACICNAPYFRVNGKCVASGTLAVGDLVEFGRYPQYENSDIPSPLTWQVLDIKDGAALMLSKYVLEQYQYHDRYEDITWEKSDVRSYLNALSGKNNKTNIDHTSDGFFKNAFSADEQKRIKEVTNKNPNNKWNESTPGGNDTKDKVFLLSHDEVLQYFPTKKSRIAHPTAYAIHPPEGRGRRNTYTCQVTCSGDNNCRASGCHKVETNVHACSNVQCGSLWWLRSPGHFLRRAAYVGSGGVVYFDHGSSVDSSHPGLRPALYVHLNI